MDNQEKEFVLRRLTEALNLGGKEYDGRWWLALAIPLLILALVYVVWMYRRDSQSVGWRWASFLGLLRSAVYLVLGAIFLLPAEQVWDKSTNKSKVVLLLDVSGSMGNKDDLPTEAVPIEKMLTRQDKVIRFLSDAQLDFLRRLQKKNPITAYRFGSVVDEESQVFADGRFDPAGEWTKWLKPEPRIALPEGPEDEEKQKLRKKAELHALLVNGTNLGDALLSVINRESNNMLQGIIVVSDGRSTAFSTQTFDEVRARAHKSQVPIFAIAIGEYREPVNIHITGVGVPDTVRPDDRFPIRVEIDGEGKADQEAEVHLDIYKPETEQPTHVLTATARFKPGEPPHAQAEFQLDPATLPDELKQTDPASGKPELLEGKWKFVARVDKDKREVYVPKEHVSDPEYVNILKKPLRVLLFAGGPAREYQFLRSLLVREMDQKRAEVSIYLQNAKPDIVQDVPNDRLLRDFPNAIRDVNDPNEKPDDKYYNLMQYDVILAFDPDWTRLEPEQLATLETWIQRHDGGLVFLAGPVNTFQLTRGINADKVKALLELLPVLLEDNRIQEIDRSTTDPWRLNFPGATSDMEFLKLNEDVKDPLSGWEEFFTGRKPGEEGGRELPVRRGFYDFYPVREVKPSATVVATFTDPRARMKDSREQPFLVTMPYGGGKVIYVSSAETWRLRQCQESFHERFWTKLLRFASSGGQGGRKNRGAIVMGKTFTANHFVPLDARLLGRDMAPLPKTEHPKVTIKGPAGAPALAPIELQPKPSAGSDWEGWFSGRFLVSAPGTYELQLPIPGTTDTLTSKFMVKESNPELDNTKPDFGQLRQVASAAGDHVLRRVPDEVRGKLKPELERTNSTLGADGDLRLFFDLKAADMIPECMDAEQRIQKSRGPIKDLWDYGWEFGNPPMKISLALVLVIGLLSVEWLTRKLLKLA
jgi:hypothetical protein